MTEYTVTMSFSACSAVRILVTAGDGRDSLRAVLPPPRQVRHPRAALVVFLEIPGLVAGLLSARCLVSAAEPGRYTRSCSVSPTSFGHTQRGVYYNVEVVEPSSAGAARDSRGVGEFRELAPAQFHPGGRL